MGLVEAPSSTQSCPLLLANSWCCTSSKQQPTCDCDSLVLRSSSWLCHQEANCCKMRIPVLNQRIKIPQQFCIHQPPRVFASHDPGRMREQRHWWRQLRVSECKTALITTSDSLVCSSRNSSTRATTRIKSSQILRVGRRKFGDGYDTNR